VDILKYFYEEPASLEVLSADTDPDARRVQEGLLSLQALLQTPRYYRGYLAGTNMETRQVGLTALGHTDAFVKPVLDWLGETCWMAGDQQGDMVEAKTAQIKALLHHPGKAAVLVAADKMLPQDLLAAVIGRERRYALPALRQLLDKAQVVFFPEPAHHGFDWSFFSRHPMREAFVAAMQRHPAEGVRRFVIPFQQARSEHKFYFESWQLGQPLPDYMEEL